MGAHRGNLDEVVNNPLELDLLTTVGLSLGSWGETWSKSKSHSCSGLKLYRLENDEGGLLSREGRITSKAKFLAWRGCYPGQNSIIWNEKIFGAWDTLGIRIPKPPYISSQKWLGLCIFLTFLFRQRNITIYCLVGSPCMLEEWKDMEPLLCPNMSCCKKRQKNWLRNQWPVCEPRGREACWRSTSSRGIANKEVAIVQGVPEKRLL